MTLFRKTPPEYRALVVENEREFRADLVYTIESLDVGISVIAEAADYDDAIEIISTTDIDLLITDINLTDLPRFEVGNRDGTALARYARDHFDTPSIFLTAFADYDPEVVAQAALSDPIGFIQKHGAAVSAQVQQLILLAMRRLELARREREATQQLAAVIEHVANALVFIDREGRIVDFNEGAMHLLQEPGDALLDQHWEDVLRFELPQRDNQQKGSLHSLIEQAAGGFFQAVSLKRADGRSLLCSLRLTPTEHLREHCSLLMIRNLEQQAVNLTSTGLSPGSTLLMVGLGRSKQLQELDPSQLRMMMLELRAALASAARRGDYVSRPVNTMLAVIMPDTDEGTAYDIARSLIGAVQGILGPLYPAVTLRGGIAHRSEDLSASGVIAAAIDALDRAERSADEVVSGASQRDTVQEVSFDENPQRALRRRINLGFEITARILDVPSELAHDLSTFYGMLDNCLHNIPGVWGYSICGYGSGGDGSWTEYRQLADLPGEQGTFLHKLKDTLNALPQRLNEEYGARLPALSFHEYDGLQIMPVALTQGRESCGLLAVVLAPPAEGKAVRQASERELQLGRVAGDHLGPILKRVLRPPAGNPALTLAADQSYNLYALRNDCAELATARLFLELDTPIALISESGMHRSRMLAWAGETSRCTLSGSSVLDGATWKEESQRADLLLRVSARDKRLLIVREPQRMHPSLQALLATIMRERSLPADEARGLAMPTLRFAVTLPAPPRQLCDRGLLDPSLASALGAGSITLPPLRELPRQELLSWARSILQHEAHSARRVDLTLDLTAEQAIIGHSWPGNLQELQDRVHDAVSRSPRDALSALDLGLFQLQSVVPGPLEHSPLPEV